MMYVKWIRLLNYMDYDKFEAKKMLMQKYGWQDYGWKHFESIYTRFYQGYILPTRFGYDKRQSHLSSLICSDMISRTEGLCDFWRTSYPDEQKRLDLEYVIKKLGITREHFDYLMLLPKQSYHDFPNNEWILRSDLFQKIYQSCTSI
jgi:hypothetical protein